MRTKNLLFAMTLPVAFAACSSEEFETLQGGQVNLGARKGLGDVTLVFDGGNADTRLEIGQSGIGFSKEDGVGACLVDQPNANYGDEDKSAIEQYDLSQYIASNYLYKTVDAGATWTTEARMVEGNYVFYAPQNESHLVRTAIKAEFPNPQVITVKDGKPEQYAAVQQLIDAKTPMYVGYKFLDAATQTNDISVKMKPIYAYPKITLKNSFGVGLGNPAATSATKDLVVNRIILSNALGFVQKTTVNVGTANNVASKDALGVVGYLFNGASAAKDNGTWENSSKLIGCYTSHVLKQNGTNEEAVAAAIIINFETPVVLAKDQSLSVNAVVPAETYTNLKIGVYTDQGYFENTVASCTLVPGQMYPSEEYMANGELNQTVKGTTLVNELKAARVSGSVVSTTEELIDLVKTGKPQLEVMPLNSDVEFNSTVSGYMLPTQKITFTAPVTVADVEVDKDIEFKANVNVKGNVNFNKNTIVWNDGATPTPTYFKVKVLEGATLTLTDVGETKENTVVPAEGATVVPADGNMIELIDEKAEGTISIQTNITLPNSVNFDSYAGDIEIASGKTLTLGRAFKNEGALTNNGTLTVGALTLTNSGTLTNNGIVVGTGGAIENEGTIENNNIIDAAVTLKGEYTDATHYKVAKLTVANGALVNKAISARNIGTANQNALVNVVEVAKNAIFSANAGALTNGTAVYTINENVTKDPTANIQKIVNKLVINGNVVAASAALDVTFDQAVEVNGNVQAIGKNITFSGATSVAVSGQIYASGGTVTLTAASDVSFGSMYASSNVTLTKAAKVTVNGNIALEGATLELPLADGVAMEIAANSTISGNGTMSFTGTTTGSTITVNKNKTLTINAATVTGGTQKLTFVSEVGTGSDKSGKVENNGSVKKATEAYSGTAANVTQGQGWWSGTPASQS